MLFFPPPGVSDAADATIKEQRRARQSFGANTQQWRLHRHTSEQLNLDPETVFQKWVEQARAYISDKKLTVRAFFRLFDRDGDGFLTTKEVTKAIEEFKGINLGKQEIAVRLGGVPCVAGSCGHAGQACKAQRTLSHRCRASQVLIKYWDKDNSKQVDYHEFTQGIRYKHEAMGHGKAAGKSTFKIPSKCGPL